MGNVLQQGWSAMVSPRKAQEPNEAATAIQKPTGEFAENPLDKKTPLATASKPTENTQTVAPTQSAAPQPPVVATLPQTTVASLPLSTTQLLPSVQTNPLLPTTQSLVPTMNSFQPQPLLTPNVGGVPITMTPPNPLNPQNALPAIADPTQTLLAQLKASNDKLTEMLTQILNKQNACGCASGVGTCGCTTKPETASKPITETKLAQSKETEKDKKVGNTKKNKVS
jgi:hypothetical protein